MGLTTMTGRDKLNIGPYRLDGELKSTANGHVGTATNTASGKRVFIKRFNRCVMPSDEALRSGGAATLARRESFRAYERQLKRLDSCLMSVCGRSRVLVKPLDIVRAGNKLVHVTELVDTEKVVAAEDVHTRFTRDQIMAMFRELLVTVGGIHSQGIVLVDVKDSNLFVLDGPCGPHARLFDYDDAVFEDAVPSSSEIIGTPEYYSPELALYIMHSEKDDPLGQPGSPLARAVSRRHDIFALGLVLHLYLTGSLPGDAKGSDRPVWQVLKQGGDDALVLSPSLSAEDRALIAWMLHRNPDERPRSCGEVVVRLSGRGAAGRAGATASPAGIVTPSASWKPSVRPLVSTEGDDIVFGEKPRPGGVLSLTALPNGRVRIRMADGRALEKSVRELKLYGLADQVDRITGIGRARFGALW